MNEQITKEWDNASGAVAKQIAADLAIQIQASRITAIPENASIAYEWNVSERTVRRAKKLLGDEGVIRKDDTGRYYLPG